MTRPQGGTAIILLMGGLALITLGSYSTLLLRTPAPRSAIEMDAARFQALRGCLAARGVVGYLSDTGDGMEGTKAYYLTEYYLAPVVVARDAAHELVVANFASPAALDAAAGAHDLAVERNFGNGVALLRRRMP